MAATRVHSSGSGSGGGGNEPAELPLSARILAAGFGSLLTCLIVTPLDVVKVRMQSQAAAKPAKVPINAHVCCCHPNSTSFLVRLMENHQYRGVLTRNKSHITGTVDGLVKIIKYEGVLSLWKGLQPTLVMTIPTTAIYFACYDGIKYRLKSSPYVPDSLSFFVPIISGSFSRIFASTVASPFEIIRTQMQASRGKSKNFVQMMKQIANSPSKIWAAGLGPTLLRDVPFSAIYWTVIELFKSSPITDVDAMQRHPFVMSFFGGAISGFIASMMTHPFDVIKTKIQVEASSDHKKQRSTLRIAKGIIRESGVMGLFSGAVPRVLRVVPSCAIMLGSYDLAKDIFLKHSH